MNLPTTPHCWILNAGSVGDTIASLPVLKYAINNIFIDNKYKVMTHEHLRPLFQFIPEDNIIYFGKGVELTEPHVVLYYYNVEDPEYQGVSGFNNLKTSLVDYVSIKFLSKLLPEEHKNYPKLDLSDTDISEFNLPEKYVCISTTVLHKNRSIPKADIYRIANYLLEQGIIPIFMGKKVQIIDPNIPTPRCGISPPAKEGMLDLSDKTTLLQAAKIMDSAIAVVGADTGLIHLAACTDVPIICGYTTVDPDLRMPYRHGIKGWNFHVITPPKTDCRYCASSMYLSNISFNDCYQKEFQCIDSLSAESYISILKDIINA